MSETTTETITSNAKTPGVPSRTAITLKMHGHVNEAIEVILELMRNKDAQDSVRLSAANKIIDKCLPDMKAVELTGEDSGPLVVRIIEDIPSLTTKTDE